MPGIFGVCTHSAIPESPNLFSAMATSMGRGLGHAHVHNHMDMANGLFLGRVNLGVLNAQEQPVRDHTGRFLLLFHGELLNNPKSSSDPEHALNMFLRDGDHCAAGLKGSFHFVVYDARSRVLKLFSDKYGLLPLYYSIGSDRMVFAAGVKAILQDRRVRRNLDYRSFADFLHFGQILGNKTLFEDVALLPPGSVLTFDLNSCEKTLQSYWNLDSLFVENGAYNPAISCDDAATLLIESIKTASRPKDSIGLSLSGGLDSRAILAGMGKDAEGVYTYTLGLPGCADQKLAEKMSRIAGTRHEFIELDRGYLQDFNGMANNMIRLSDGMYHPHESTEMLALNYLRNAAFKILLRGHGGELAKASLAYPVMATPEVYSLSKGKEATDFIFRSTNLVIRDIQAKALLTPDAYSRTKDAARQSLEESCGRVCEKLEPADLCLYYYASEHIRRQVVASLDIFRTQVEIRLPYLDEDYLKVLLQLPVNKRNSGEVHCALIKRCMPELVKIPNSNTGAPLDASPLRLAVTDKFNSLMRRLRVRGFRHYTEFQDWQRHSFREATGEILFGSQLTQRGLFEPRALKTVFEQHVSGKKDYAHLLGTIVGIELWFRNFVDSLD